MVRLSSLALLCFLTACRTSTPLKAPPTALWELPLELEAGQPPRVTVTIDGAPARLVVDTAASAHSFTGTAKLGPLTLTGTGTDGTLAITKLLERGAVVLDFPNKRLLAIDGGEMSFLRWLDERSPKGQLEGVGRAGNGVIIKTRVGDGQEIVTQVATTQQHTAYARELFDPKLVKGDTVPGLFVRVRESEFGPLEAELLPEGAAPQGRLGLDVLSGLVVLVPMHAMAPIWFMTPRE
ncbi:MAG TPA: hypothetical protein VGD87_00980 [Archangium sp.]